MKIYTIEEISELMAEQGYKYCSLVDYAGTPVIPYNSHKMTSATRLKEIEKRLGSKALKDGYYYVKCKNAIQTKVSDDYMIYKGEKPLSDDTPVPAPAPILIQEKINFQPEVLTYEGALKLQVELERLKLENAALKKELEQLQLEIKEYESDKMLSEDENKTPQLLENAKSFLSEIVQFAAPLLDKHFELKEKALGVKALEIQSRSENIQRQNATGQKRQSISIEDFINLHKEDENLYNDLVSIYNSAQSVEDFHNKLKDFDSNLFENLLNYGK